MRESTGGAGLVARAHAGLDKIDAMPPGPERDEELRKAVAWIDANAVALAKELRVDVR